MYFKQNLKPGASGCQKITALFQSRKVGGKGNLIFMFFSIVSFHLKNIISMKLPSNYSIPAQKSNKPTNITSS
jgi:hypothetical protein